VKTSRAVERQLPAVLSVVGCSGELDPENSVIAALVCMSPTAISTMHHKHILARPG
jgi:hypothetical protein